MAWPGDAAGHVCMRASDADRERMADTLKAAFAEGRLTKDQFDARIGQTFASRTYAELATITAGIPARSARAQPRQEPRRQVSNAVRWGTSGFITPAIAAVAFTFASTPGDGRYGAIAFVIAFAYFVFWLSAGADMLWEWYCMASPTARMCVRCAHSAASHRAPRSCTVRRGSLNLWGHCSCAGYVPPGLSPKVADQRPLQTAARERGTGRMTEYEDRRRPL
jgi:Domain of unknown function (DUF1707)